MWIWEPARQWIEQTNIWRFMHRLGFDDREQFLAWSREHRVEFWSALEKEVGIEWFRPYDRVLDDSRGPEWCRWFEGGELNIAHNCLDRHAMRTPDGEAIRWDCEDGSSGEVKWRELSVRV